MQEIVIKIDEDVYTRLFNNGIQDNEIATDDICEMAKAIRNGTVLPKGHGDLIDVSEYFNKEFGDAREFLDKAERIIEADKESEE